MRNVQLGFPYSARGKTHSVMSCKQLWRRGVHIGTHPSTARLHACRRHPSLIPKLGNPGRTAGTTSHLRIRTRAMGRATSHPAGKPPFLLLRPAVPARWLLVRPLAHSGTARPSAQSSTRVLAAQGANLLKGCSQVLQGSAWWQALRDVLPWGLQLSQLMMVLQ